MAGQRRTALPFRVRDFNHVTLTVSNLQRSIGFYQSLFGLPLQARQGAATATFGIGAGHRISDSRPSLPAAIVALKSTTCVWASRPRARDRTRCGVPDGQ